MKTGRVFLVETSPRADIRHERLHSQVWDRASGYCCPEPLVNYEIEAVFLLDYNGKEQIGGFSFTKKCDDVKGFVSFFTRSSLAKSILELCLTINNTG